MRIEIRVKAEINRVTASKVFKVNTLNASIKPNRVYRPFDNYKTISNATYSINKDVDIAEVLIR